MTERAEGRRQNANRKDVMDFLIGGVLVRETSKDPTLTSKGAEVLSSLEAIEP